VEQALLAGAKSLPVPPPSSPPLSPRVVRMPAIQFETQVYDMLNFDFPYSRIIERSIGCLPILIMVCMVFYSLLFKRDDADLDDEDDHCPEICQMKGVYRAPYVEEVQEPTTMSEKSG
jgi:hypothetical protein